MTTRTLSVVLPDADYVKIRDSAMKHHLPISSYVRSVVMRHINGDLDLPTPTPLADPAPTTKPASQPKPTPQAWIEPTPDPAPERQPPARAPAQLTPEQQDAVLKAFSS